MMSSSSRPNEAANDDFWNQVSQNKHFSQAKALNVNRPETPHLLNIYENNRPITRNGSRGHQKQITNSHNQLTPDLDFDHFDLNYEQNVNGAGNVRGGAKRLPAGYTPNFQQTGNTNNLTTISRPISSISAVSTSTTGTLDQQTISVYNVKLQPLKNAPTLPSLEEVQARLKATKERRFLRKTRYKKEEKRKNYNLKNLPPKSLTVTSNSLNLARDSGYHQGDGHSHGHSSFSYIPKPPSTAASISSEGEPVNTNTDRQSSSSSSSQRPDRGDQIEVGIGTAKFKPQKPQKSKQKSQELASLNSAIEVIQNLSNKYTTAERIRSAQLAMRLSPGSQNSYAISKTLFQFSQKEIHCMASPAMVKDLLAFLAICGSKPLKRYHSSVLYTLGSLRSISASWKTASNKIDFEDLCDEIIEYVSLVIEVVLNIKPSETEACSVEKILIQSTGLIRNTIDKVSNIVDTFKYHDTFTSLFIILRRYYKNFGIVLNLTRIFSGLEMEQLIKNEPDCSTYFNFLIFSLEENELNKSDESNLQQPTTTQDTRLLEVADQNLSEIKNDHFKSKVLYLLGNMAEFIGSGLDYFSVGRQLLNLITTFLREKVKFLKDLKANDVCVNCFRLLGNLTMEENYSKEIVNDKTIATLIRLYLNSRVGLDNLLFGVIHNISSFEVQVDHHVTNEDKERGFSLPANGSPGEETVKGLPVFFKFLLEDLLMPEGTVFRNACEENRIVCMAILANVSKYVTDQDQINVILLLATHGLCSESSQTVYMCLGILSNLSGNRVIRLNNGVLAAILGTLEDFLTIDVIFVYLSCKILSNLYKIEANFQSPPTKTQVDSSIILNLVSVLQDITDEESSIEILNGLLDNCQKSGHESIQKEWFRKVVPLAGGILREIGDAF